MKVSTKLAGALGLLTSIVVVLVVFHIRTIHDAVSTSYDLAEISSRLSLITSDQLGWLNQLEENAGKYRVTRDPGYFEKFEEALTSFDATLGQLHDLRLSPDEEREIILLASEWGKFRPLAEQFVESTASALAIAGLDPIAGLREPLSVLRWQTRRLSEASQAVMATRLAESAESARRMERVSIVGAAIALFFSVLISVLIVRSIAHELHRLKEGTRAVAGGNFDYRLPVDREDEFSQLARDFNVMTRRLAELERMKSDFLSKVSHDLKTPLASMQEATRILLDEVPGTLTPKQRHFLTLSSHSGDRLSSMIADILDLSGMKEGAFRLSIDSQPLHPLGYQAVQQLEPALHEHAITISFDPGPTPIHVPCDGNRMIQVMANLLTNAVKFSPTDGTVEFTIETVSECPRWLSRKQWDSIARRSADENIVLITVADRGPGVAPADRTRIFEQFVQTDAGRQVSGRGVGLGLAISREIVTAHGGVIGVTDRAGGGSLFYVLLPGSEQPVRSGGNLAAAATA